MRKSTNLKKNKSLQNSAPLDKCYINNKKSGRFFRICVLYRFHDKVIFFAFLQEQEGAFDQIFF